MLDRAAEAEYLLGRLSLRASELDLVRGRLASMLRNIETSMTAKTEGLLEDLASISRDLESVRGKLALLFRDSDRNQPADLPLFDRTKLPQATTDPLSAEAAIGRSLRRAKHQDIILELLRNSPGGLSRHQIIERVGPQIETRTTSPRKALVDALCRLAREQKIRMFNDKYFVS